MSIEQDSVHITDNIIWFHDSTCGLGDKIGKLAPVLLIFAS